MGADVPETAVNHVEVDAKLVAVEIVEEVVVVEEASFQ